jgi:hypothetical protein
MASDSLSIGPLARRSPLRPAPTPTLALTPAPAPTLTPAPALTLTRRPPKPLRAPTKPSFDSTPVPLTLRAR